MEQNNFTIPVICDKDGDVFKEWYVYFEFTYNGNLHQLKKRGGVMGKLKQKKPGQQRNPDSTHSSTPLETLDYSYNIRGWLKGINKDYANNTSQGRWFGMELSCTGKKLNRSTKAWQSHII